MKRIFFLAVLLVLGFIASAQQLKVVEFRADYSLTDAVRFPKEDLNGDRCGLILLGLVMPDATFEGNIISAEYKEGEWRIYMAPNANWLNIKTKDFVPLRYDFSSPIESNVTYVMTVVSDASLVEEQQYLSFKISPNSATLEVDGEIWPVSWEGTARKRVEVGAHTYQVHTLNYESEKGEVVVKDTTVVVRVSLKALPKEKKKTNRWETFITLNGSYAPFSMGFSVGQVKRFGWFVSAMTNGSFTGMGNLPQVDTQGFLDDGHLPMYNGTKATDRLSIIAGGMMRVVEPLYVRVGVGYGAYNLCWQDKEQNWYKIKGYSFQGVDVSAGMQAHLGGFVVSLEAVTTNFQTLEGKLGLGYSF